MNKEAHKEEWKAKMKSLKDEKKKLKKLEKEEDLRRRRTGPMNSHIVLIDEATREKLTGGGQKVGRSQATSLTLNDFPALGSAAEEGRGTRGARLVDSSPGRSWSQLVETRSRRRGDNFPSLQSSLEPRGTTQQPGTKTEAVSSLSPVTRQPVVTAAREEVKPPTQTQPKQRATKKKRKDPIVVDLYAVLVNKKSAKRDKKHLVLGSKYRKANRDVLSGNILDSANPRRNKGKHRENKRKKLSKLKTAVIRERILKWKARETALRCAVGTQEVLEEVDMKMEVEAYLARVEEVKRRNGKESDLGRREGKMCGRTIAAGECVEIAHVEIKRTECVGERSPVEMTAQVQEVESTTSTSVEGNSNKETAQAQVQSSVNEAPQVQSSTDSSRVPFSSKFREYCSNFLTPDLNAAVKKLLQELVYLQDRSFARDPIKAHARKRLVSGFREAKKYLKLKKVKMLVIAPNLEKLEAPGPFHNSQQMVKDRENLSLQCSVNELVSELKAGAVSAHIPCVFSGSVNELVSELKAGAVSAHIPCVFSGSVNELVSELKAGAVSAHIPCVFALDRRKLGHVTLKKVPVSVVAILNYEGIEALFSSVVSHLQDAESRLNEQLPKPPPEPEPEPEPAPDAVPAPNQDVTSQVISSFLTAFAHGCSVNDTATETSDAMDEPDILELNEDLNPFLKALDLPTSASHS